MSISRSLLRRIRNIQGYDPGEVLPSSHWVRRGGKKHPRSFEKALSLDPSRDEARSALFRLGLIEDTTGWRLPFRLADLFAPPTPEEMRRVKDDWKKRDLSPRGVQIVSTGRMNLRHTSATVRVVSHRVHGFLHYGAVIVPEGGDKKGVILEAKRVSWDYFPLNIDGGVLSPRILGSDQGRFVYVVPSFRGERIIGTERPMMRWHFWKLR